MKKIIAVLICGAVMLFLAACIDNTSSQSSIVDDGRLTGVVIDKNMAGKLETVYQSEWCTFSIDSMRTTKEFAGYETAKNKILLDIVVTQTNILDSKVILSNWDFYLDAKEFPDYIDAMDAYDSSMMPYEYSLESNETKTYHVVFEIPPEPEDLVLYYTNVDKEGNILGTIGFSIDIMQLYAEG